MKRWFLTVIALVTLFAVLLSACATTPTAAPADSQAQSETKPTDAPKPADGKNPVEIRWFVGLGTGGDPEQLEAQKAVVEKFNASHPDIKLVMEIVTYNAAYDTLATEVASGNPPDIVGPVGVSGANSFFGLWLDLDPLITKTGYDLSQFDKGAVDFYKVGGEGQIGLPFAIFPSVLFYQPEMFEEAGLNTPPHQYGEKYKWPDGTEEEWNFATLRKVAMKLTVDKNGKDATSPDFDKANIVQYGYVPQYQDLRAVGSYFGAGSLVEEDLKTAQIPSQWVDAWKWFNDGMWVDHFIPTDPIIQSEAFGAGNPFNSGKVAMAVTHTWYTCCVESAGEKWDIAAVPSYNGKVTANFNADTFRIMKSTKHPDEAFTVLTYLIGEASLDLLAVYGGTPARTSDQKAFFDGLNAKFPQGVDWQVAVDSIPFADNPSFEGYMPAYQEAYNRGQTFFTLMNTTEGVNVDEEVAKLKTDLQAIFDKAQ